MRSWYHLPSVTVYELLLHEERERVEDHAPVVQLFLLTAIQSRECSFNSPHDAEWCYREEHLIVVGENVRM